MAAPRRGAHRIAEDWPGRRHARTFEKTHASHHPHHRGQRRDRPRACSPAWRESTQGAHRRPSTCTPPTKFVSHSLSARRGRRHRRHCPCSTPSSPPTTSTPSITWPPCSAPNRSANRASPTASMSMAPSTSSKWPSPRPGSRERSIHLRSSLKQHSPFMGCPDLATKERAGRRARRTSGASRAPCTASTSSIASGSGAIYDRYYRQPRRPTKPQPGLLDFRLFALPRAHQRRHCPNRRHQRLRPGDAARGGGPARPYASFRPRGHAHFRFMAMPDAVRRAAGFGGGAANRAVAQGLQRGRLQTPRPRRCGSACGERFPVCAGELRAGPEAPGHRGQLANRTVDDSAARADWGVGADV